MYEIAAFVTAKKPFPLSVIEYPNGRFGFVGRVPEGLAYVGSPDDLKTGRMMGMGLLIRSGRVKSLSWDSREAALAAAAALGFSVANGEG